jgi:hypothetical protein
MATDDESPMATELKLNAHEEIEVMKAVMNA